MYGLYKNLIKDYKYVINYKAIVQIWFRRQSSKYIIYYKELIEICNIIVHKLVTEEIQVTYNLFIVDIIDVSEIVFRFSMKKFFSTCYVLRRTLKEFDTFKQLRYAIVLELTLYNFDYRYPVHIF